MNEVVVSCSRDAPASGASAVFRAVLYLPIYLSRKRCPVYGAVKASRVGGKGWAPTAHTYRHGTPAGVLQPARGHDLSSRWTVHAACQLSFSMVRAPRVPGRHLGCRPRVPPRHVPGAAAAPRVPRRHPGSRAPAHPAGATRHPKLAALPAHLMRRRGDCYQDTLEIPSRCESPSHLARRGSRAAAPRVPPRVPRPAPGLPKLARGRKAGSRSRHPGCRARHPGLPAPGAADRHLGCRGSAPRGGSRGAGPGCRGGSRGAGRGSRGAGRGSRGGTSGAGAPLPISGTTYGMPLPISRWSCGLGYGHTHTHTLTHAWDIGVVAVDRVAEGWARVRSAFGDG